MDTQTLTITFKGICSHYTDVVPGVRHRVVMPDASQVHMGLLSVPDPVPPLAYYLLPHYVSLTGASQGTPLEVDGIVRNGYVYSGVRLYVANAIDKQTLNVDDWKTTPRVADYVPDFKPSNEVVMGGRAAAYFDIDGGTFTSLQEKSAPGQPDGPFYTTVTIKTDGAPVLALTPFGSKEFPAVTVTASVGNSLTVANADWDTRDEDKPFDFLLHYLCAERGIPQALKVATPGLFNSGHPPPKLELAQIRAALAGLGCSIVNGHPSRHRRSNQAAGRGRWPLVLTTSCSDTKYP